MPLVTALGRPKCARRQPATRSACRPKRRTARAARLGRFGGRGQSLEGLAPLAGESPRAVKRFVNLYRIARIQAPENRPVLAFMLALDQGGSDIESRRSRRLSHGNDDASLGPASASRLWSALAAMWPHGRVKAARRAAAVKIYSLRF